MAQDAFEANVEALRRGENPFQRSNSDAQAALAQLAKVADLSNHKPETVAEAEVILAEIRQVLPKIEAKVVRLHSDNAKFEEQNSRWNFGIGALFVVGVLFLCGGYFTSILISVANKSISPETESFLFAAIMVGWALGLGSYLVTIYAGFFSQE